LFMLLIACSFAAIIRLRSANANAAAGSHGALGAGIFMGLAILTRPEAALLLPAAAIYLAITEGIPPHANFPAGEGRTLLRIGGKWTGAFVRILTPGCVVLAGEALLAMAVTGSLTPGTATVKLRFFQEYDLSLTSKLNTTGDFIGLFLGPLIAPLAFAAATV